MKLLAAFAILALCALASASFEYLYFYNGTNLEDPDDYFQFSKPVGLLRSGSTLYVSDPGRNTLYSMDATGPNRTSIVTASGQLENPMRMVLSSDIVYIADGYKVKTYSGAGSEILDWSQGTNIQRASSLLIEGDTVYIADMERGKVFAYSNSSRAYSGVAIESGPSDGQLSAPQDIKHYGNRYYVSDSAKKLVYVYNETFGFLQSIGRGKGNVVLLSPRGIDLSNDRLYVADSSGNRVVVFTLDGYPIEILNATANGGNFSYPEGVMVDGDRLFVADSGSRMVKVFSINLTRGNDSVLGLISTANYSVSKLQSLQQIAAKLSVGFDPSTAPQDLADAQADYDNFLFSSASVLAQKAADRASADYGALSQAVEVKVRKTAKEQSDLILPYRSQATGQAAASLAQFDNKLADIDAKLSSKSYLAAAEAALALPQQVDALIKEITDQKAAEEEKNQGKSSQQAAAQLQSVVDRLAIVKAKAAYYRQTIDTTVSETLISAANISAQQGDPDSANSSLSLALVEIGSYESTLNSAAQEIEAAISNISIVELQLNATAAKPVLLAPDFSDEHKLMAQAKDAAFSNPQLGIAMAVQARDTAAAKMRDAQAVSIAAAAVLVIVVMIAVIAIAFYLHLRRRKNAARQQAEAEKRREERAAKRK